ncbi:hypothetical protein [Tahibacter amnicola]|uniref:Beta-ketoacyl-[acyl-carrier-protein] synthase III N-terminal domain-containing protein n=1 Tax=Tahibacter amnicola TaxID=2976241 RepID=A0ABY6B8T7_9GAMM|nr:hypothetical protein [Tahibacter amnicola]UXI66197.1 hypothetical protein N4264_15720 [Tahibacter amnicola]
MPDRSLSVDSIAPGIIDADYYLPGEPLDIVQWGAKVGLPGSLIDRLLENGCRHFHQTHTEGDVDLIAQAVRPLLQRRSIDPAKITYLVHAHTQQFSMPAPPRSILSELSARFGWAPKLALSVGHLACAAVVNAIDVARRLLEHDESAEYALVVTADRVFGGPNHRVRQDAGIQSDGAAVILLGRDNVRARFRDVLVRNYPRLAEGPSSPAMGQLIGTLAWAQTRQVLIEAEQRLGHPLGALGGIFPTNADAPYWKSLADKMKLPPDLVFLDNMRDRGHSCCSDLAINLVDAGFARLDRGESILCLSQSNVGAYGVVALEHAA